MSKRQDLTTHWDPPRHLVEQGMKSSHLVGVVQRRHALRQADRRSPPPLLLRGQARLHGDALEPFYSCWPCWRGT